MVLGGGGAPPGCSGTRSLRRHARPRRPTASHRCGTWITPQKEDPRAKSRTKSAGNMVGGGESNGSITGCLNWLFYKPISVIPHSVPHPSTLLRMDADGLSENSPFDRFPAAPCGSKNAASGISGSVRPRAFAIGVWTSSAHPVPTGPGLRSQGISASRRWSASGARSSFVAAAQVESRESSLLDLKAHLDRPAADGTVLNILGRA